MTLKMFKQKKAAMEMSVGTIVTIVLLVSVLVLGLILIKNIMCAGIIITDQISAGVENELKNLFGVNDYGVKCMGEESQEIKLGDGGRRKVFCVINVDETTKYKLKVKDIESLKGAKTSVVKTWVLDEDWSGTVSSGQATQTILLLNIPKNVDDTSLKIDIEVENENTGSIDTHTSYIDVKHVGTVTSAMC